MVRRWTLVMTALCGVTLLADPAGLLHSLAATVTPAASATRSHPAAAGSQSRPARAPTSSAPQASSSQAPGPRTPSAPATTLPASTPAVPAAAALSPRNANYSIDADLDPSRHQLRGREVITWRNITRAPTREVRLHLYYNAWRNTRSTWLRERALVRPPLDVSRLGPDDWSGIDIVALRLLGAGSAPPIDLLPAARFIAPDDGNPDDRTLMAVALPTDVGPEGTINLAVEWLLRVPRTFARTGRIGDFYFLAQWFPKVAVLEDAGWVSHQFHASTEFYSDYGTYDVRLTVPTGWVVGATGLPQPAPAARDNAVTTRFVQDDVHDFAFVASPHLIEHNARFEHATLPAVDIRVLLQPEHAGQAERHVAATRATLKYYGEWFGAYPYSHITVVDPAWQSGAGGMEYPTLVTAGTEWLAPARVADPEGVTIHEVGHQFWYGLVGNNEFDHAWMDEGLNTYATGRALEAAYPPFHDSVRFFGDFVPWVFRHVLLSRETDANRMRRYRPDARSDVPATPSWQYHPATGRNLTYAKTALWLHTLERYLGWPMMQRVMSTFFARYRFKHPTPDDFFRVASEVSGQDLTWFFDQVHRSSNVFDYGIASLVSGPSTVSGSIDAAPGQANANAATAQAATTQAATPQAPRVVSQQREDGVYVSTVTVRRYGEALFPVDVVTTLEDGRKIRERWNGLERWISYTYRGPHRAVSADVDPDRVLVLDVNRTNNSFTLAPAGQRAANKWTLTWVIWLQDLMLTYGFFA